MSDSVSIIGAGPAGAAAALAVVTAGGRALVYEQSAFPRHKVCGEFFTPEIIPLLQQIGLAAEFRALLPAVVSRAELHFDGRCRRFPLPEPALGLSRWTFDDFLLRAALARGASLRRERAPALPGAIRAAGRAAASPRGRRLFGFKAHFSGPASDAVELFFFSGGYCGLCPIERGLTNVCGLIDEARFRDCAFDGDALLDRLPRLRSRLHALDRRSSWLLTGPLRFGRAPHRTLAAGDAACFLDPFTGSGLLAAVQTGLWAGQAALRPSDGPAWYRRRCSSFYRRQLAASAIARRLLSLGCAGHLAAFLPGALLFRLTRPAG